MEIAQICPVCQTRFSSHVRQEWNVVEGRKVLTLELKSQSVNVDHGKLEALIPYAADGQELDFRMERMDEATIRLHVTRKPRTGEPAERVEAKKPLRKKSRPDLETEAAELGIPVNKKLTDDQLIELIVDKKRANPVV